MASDLVEVTPDGRLRLYFHPGQWRAWESTKRIVVVLAGTQGGKTSFGPAWLYREIQRKGPGDYMVVTPTFQLLELKALPEFRRLFEQLLRLGKYVGAPSRHFDFSRDGALRIFGDRDDPAVTSRVLFGYAADPDSLESASAKAAWCDEAGQKKFKGSSWDAILRRLSLAEGRALLTTTPYDLGWLKQRLWDKRDDPDADVEVVRFDSTENPAFPRAEFERARRDLPGWKFDLFYRAIFTRPAGLIYDSFDPARHVVPRFAIPPDWPRYWGLDFGGVHTACLFYAREPGTGRLYAYREYLAGGRTAVEHASHLLAGEPGLPERVVGGSKSEGQWRSEFRAGGTVNGKAIPGIPVGEPDISDVEVGIGRVYGAHRRDEVFVFADLAGYLEQKATYSREVDDAGNPTEAIEDKSTYHFLDAERYIVGWLMRHNDRHWDALEAQVADCPRCGRRRFVRLPDRSWRCNGCGFARAAD